MRAIRSGWLAWALWGLAMLVLAAAAWLDHLLRQAGRPDLTGFDAAALSVEVAHAGLATIGAVVASRRPGHPVGWLILAFGVLGQGSFVISGYADYGLLVRPGTLPAARLVASFFPAGAVTGFACLAFIMLLTPTGALPSARWRPWAALVAASSAGLLLTVALTPAPAAYRHPRSPFDLTGFGGAQLLAYQIAFPVVLLALVTGGLSLVLRFHRAAGTERLQLRWVSLAAGLVAHAGHRGRHAGIPAVRPGSHHQPHAGLRPAHGAARRMLRRGDPGTEPAGQLFKPDRGAGHPDARGGVPAGPAAGPEPGRPAVQPASLRCRPDHPGLRRPAAGPARPRSPGRRVAGRGRPEHGADHRRLCDHHLLPGDYRDDEEDYEAGEDVDDEWDGYDDEAAASRWLVSPPRLNPGARR